MGFGLTIRQNSTKPIRQNLATISPKIYFLAIAMESTDAGNAAVEPLSDRELYEAAESLQFLAKFIARILAEPLAYVGAFGAGVQMEMGIKKRSPYRGDRLITVNIRQKVALPMDLFLHRLLLRSLLSQE